MAKTAWLLRSCYKRSALRMGKESALRKLWKGFMTSMIRSAFTLGQRLNLSFFTLDLGSLSLRLTSLNLNLSPFSLSLNLRFLSMNFRFFPGTVYALVRRLTSSMSTLRDLLSWRTSRSITGWSLRRLLWSRLNVASVLTEVRIL